MTLPAPSPALKVAFYGDDFTGSTDTLATLAAAGLRSMLFLDVPTDDELAAAGPLDALGIAGAARSMGPDQMRAELERVGRFLATLTVPVIHYKTCSTFDSAPHVGSIGVAVSVLREFVRNPLVPIVGGQPNLDRYCVYGNLFAAVASGEGVVRIDRHPTMSTHPVTPMHEADLRLHLKAQGLDRVVSFDYRMYDQPAEVQDAAIERIGASEARAVLFDVAHAADLSAIGRMVWGSALRSPLLAVGPSGVSQALLSHWADVDDDEPGGDAAIGGVAPSDGPVFLLAGSMSPVTARQLDAATSYVREPLDVDRVLADDPAYSSAWVDRVGGHLRNGRNVLAHTASVPDGAPGVAPRLAAACGALLARLLQAVTIKRVGIAGGDTSSHAVKALDIWGLTYLGLLAPGVSLCRAHSRAPHLDRMEFMLKGGQMGPVDLFETLLRGRPTDSTVVASAEAPT